MNIEADILAKYVEDGGRQRPGNDRRGTVSFELAETNKAFPVVSGCRGLFVKNFGMTLSAPRGYRISGAGGNAYCSA